MKNKIYLLVFVLFSLCPVGARPAFAASAASFDSEGVNEIITLDVKQAAPHKVFTVPNPDRLVVDVPSARGRYEAALPPSYHGKLVKTLRGGQFDPQTWRFVFDLAQSIHVVGTRVSGGKLIITIAPGIDSGLDTGLLKPPVPEKPVVPKPLPVHKPSNKSQKPLVVIDAGHGGPDPGTTGPDGTEEKDLTLEYAKALKARLLSTGRYRVKLTRDDDRFIMLRKRVEIARKENADLFISFHADSAPEQSARGLSIYTVSEQASDRETAALAARENKADVLAGIDLSDERNDVAGILISLAERDTMNRSSSFADLLVGTLDDRVRLLSNSHRFAGFAVLKAPDIPSVLIEMGFLSNPDEERNLKSKAYREKVIGGVAEGVDDYFRQMKRVTQ